jgi:hypothetical protein
MDRLRQQHPISESLPRQGRLEIGAQKRKPGLHNPNPRIILQTQYLLSNKDRILVSQGLKKPSDPTVDPRPICQQSFTGQKLPIRKTIKFQWSIGPNLYCL